MRIVLSVIILLCFVTHFAFASQTEAYLSARAALSNSDYDKYRKLYKKIDGYSLKPVLESNYILKRFDHLNSNTIESFLDNNADIYTSNAVRTKYLNKLLKQNNVNKFQQFYKKDTNNIDLECHFINNTINSKNISAEKDQRIEKLWLTANSRPDSCNPVFKTWNKAGKLTDQRVWERIELAINRSRYRLASFLAKNYLSKKEQAITDLWITVRKNPRKKLSSTGFSSTEFAGKIIADGLEQIARESPSKAVQIWGKLKSANSSLKKFDRQVFAGIGFRAAINHQPNATSYMRKASFDQEKVREWAMRTALREGQWQDVLNFFDRLTEEEKTSLDWRYWQARALEQTGQAELATEIFQQISGERDFYSFLAADKIDGDYQMNNNPITVPTEELESTRAFQAAKELYYVEDVNEMRRQWQWAIRDLDNTQLQAAAKIASSWNFHDRAIITAGKARYFDDVNLRFPVIHKSTVVANAKKQKLPEAYVYGIMRQESAFMEDVRSSAGAMGLMQIMPATGRLIWKKQKKPNYHSSRLLKPKENIAAGSFYLRDMLNTFNGHYAMATAAYNAGPRRPKQWRPNRRLDADIWIENIPFRETRGYVKNVLEFKTVYDHQLGNKMQRISKLLPKVNAG